MVRPRTCQMEIISPIRPLQLYPATLVCVLCGPTTPTCFFAWLIDIFTPKAVFQYEHIAITLKAQDCNMHINLNRAFAQSL